MYNLEELNAVVEIFKEKYKEDAKMPQKWVKYFVEKNYGIVLCKEELPTRIVAIEISKTRKNTVEIYMDGYQMAVEILDYEISSADNWENFLKIYFIGMPPSLVAIYRFGF